MHLERRSGSEEQASSILHRHILLLLAQDSLGGRPIGARTGMADGRGPWTVCWLGQPGGPRDAAVDEKLVCIPLHLLEGNDELEVI